MSTSVRSPSFRAPRAIASAAWRLAEPLAQDRWIATFRAHPAGNMAAEFVVKRARGDLATQGERELARGLLLREAAVSTQVRHRNLAATLAVEQHGDNVWLVQPQLVGATLSAAGDLPLPAVLWTIRQAAQALAALHAAAWLHGNVSPEAILLGPAGHATLGELGWCRQLASDECDLGRTPFAGQVRCAAPEMFDDAGLLTPAADIYSLGAVLLELLTGRPLLAEYEGPELVAAKRLLAAPQIDAAGIPYEVSSLTARMLSRDPLRRPTADEVVQTLVAAEIAALGDWNAAEISVS